LRSRRATSMHGRYSRCDDRHTIQELVGNYEIDEEFAEPRPTHIVIFDDMMTAGTHFRGSC